MTIVPLSILDLATVGADETVRDALEGSVALARAAEAAGYRRVWYAEHHNAKGIASSAVSVLIAHVAAHTEHIRLGSGGIMLPNHSPLVIAEQFGTLAELHPGRIDLGLGRAPGTDQVTVRALRRDITAAERFPQDVLELQAFLGEESLVRNVIATPGRRTHIPLYILGSSLFGAQLAAELGLPYGFASHFAPQALHQALPLYRDSFKPSAQLDRPYAIAGVNVVVADTEAAAHVQLGLRRRAFAKAILSPPGRKLTEDEVDVVLRSPQAAILDQMFRYTAAGTPDMVAAYLDGFATQTQADELIVVHQTDTVEARVRSVELLAEAVGGAG